jgi:hypothetical protein
MISHKELYENKVCDLPGIFLVGPFWFTPRRHSERSALKLIIDKCRLAEVLIVIQIQQGYQDCGVKYGLQDYVPHVIFFPEQFFKYHFSASAGVITLSHHSLE